MVSGHRLAELDTLHVAPQQFDRIEVGRVAGKSLDNQPGALLGDPGFHRLGPVGGQAVPEQGDLGVEVEVGAQLAEELDEGLGVVRAGLGGEDQLGSLPVGPR